jgi:hypothetical protein
MFLTELVTVSIGFTFGVPGRNPKRSGFPDASF